MLQVAIESGISFVRLGQELATGLDRLLRHEKFKPGPQIWLTGSGDSLFAAQAVLPGLERWAGIRARAVTGIEFSRYRAPLLTTEDVLWAISNSGSAARTREAVLLAQSKGILTVGVTGSESGPLAASADTYVFRPVEELPDVPEHYRGLFMNMNEFLVTMYSLMFLGLHLGVNSGAISQSRADAFLAECEDAITLLPALAAKHEAMAALLAAELKDLDTIWIIGAGPNFGTARYCAAKFHEQLPWNGIPEDLEEWAHLQYFLTLSWKERSQVIVLAPPGNSLDRAEELVEGIRGAGGRSLVVAHPDYGSFPGAMAEFRIADSGNEFLSAFTYHLPAQLLIMHLARQLGHEPYALRRADGYKLIRHGIVRENTNGLV